VLDAEGIQARSAEHRTQITCAGSGRGCGGALTGNAAPLRPGPDVHQVSRGHTLCTALAHTVEVRGDQPAYSDRLGPGGQLRALTWRQFCDTTRTVAAGLIARGVSAGDRVAIMASNRIEHIIADAAALHAGGIPVPIYLTAAPEQIAAIAAQCAPTVLVAETADQLAQWEPALAHVDRLKLIVSLDASEEAGSQSWQTLVDAGANYLGDRPHQCESRWRAVSPDQAATVVFTSGTTGAPKGVVLTHRNVVYEATALLAANDLTDAGTSVSYLPFAHIAERMLSMYLPYVAGGHVRLLADASELAETLHELRPTRFFGVPRIWEKIQTWVSAGDGAADEFTTAEVHAALDTGRRYVTSCQSGSVTPAGLLEEFSRADAQILSGLRSRAGLDRLVWAASAAAPMPEQTLKFFAGLGIRVYDAYGMTETSGTATTNTEAAYRLGSVGLPLPGVRVDIADDGEILLQGPTVSPGYYGQIDATVDPSTSGRWLHTGDLGRRDADGFLYIVGRKKEMIITSSGKNIAPAALEELLLESEFITNAIVYGDRRPYLVALITIDAAAVGAEMAGGSAAMDTDDLTANTEVLTLIQRAVDRANARVSRPEQVKKFVLLPEQWTPQGGQLTPTLKLRREVIAARHSRLLDELYGGPTHGRMA
jgi:long-chain acyl-CoA synthetase